MDEFKIQHQQIKTEIPKNSIETSNNCNVDIFPTIHGHLIVLATLPVTIASSCEN